MPKIGSKYFITLKGAVSGAGYELEEITRPGVGGVAFRRDNAPRGRTFTLESFVDVNNPQTEINACKAYQGYSTTIEDDCGKSWSNIMVLNVEPSAPPKKMLTVVGGVNGGSYLVQMRWTLRYAGF